MGLFRRLRNLAREPSTVLGQPGFPESSEFIRDDLLGGKEAKEASDAILETSRNALDLNREFARRLREEGAPAREFRNQSLSGLLDLIKGGGDFKNSFEYRSTLDAARPEGVSGGLLDALTRRGEGIASMQFQPYASRIGIQAGVGSQGLNSTNRLLQENANLQAGILDRAGVDAGQVLLDQVDRNRQAASGAAGLFGAFLSDERLKKNMTPVGKLANGLTVYTWEWKDEKHKHLPTMGVSAQEVQRVNPDAVTEDDKGTLRVNLFKATGVSPEDLDAWAA